MKKKKKLKKKTQKGMTMDSDRKELPRFKSIAEERVFWGENDFSDYVREFEAVPVGAVSLNPKLARQIRDRARKKHLIAIRLSDDEYAQAQNLALKKNFGLSTLIRFWISQGIARELKAR